MQATAFIIGPEDGSGAGLMDLCLEVGFRTVLGFTKLEQAEQQVKRTPICYFLFNADSRPDDISSISKAIRFSRNRQVRFAPLVGFSENPSQQFVSMCIHAGFDDIVAPPFSARRVSERLESLLEHRIMFYETPDYFGPDRRDHLSLNTIKPKKNKRGKGGDHRRIEITRNVDTGINILHDHFYRGGVRQTVERSTNVSGKASVSQLAI